MTNSLKNWFKSRFPIETFFSKFFLGYRVPHNLNVWYVFGVLAMALLGTQFLSGFWLTLFYVPHVDQAFLSVQRIMHEVQDGWYIRYMHTTGASFLFIVLYLHIFRGFLYGSYQKPRELVWILGCALLMLMMLEAFLGYLLPWGQMSYWGATVVLSIIEAIPLIGKSVGMILKGDASISTWTLIRFYALHVIGIPFLMISVLYLHLVALRKVGSSNPTGRALEQQQMVPFHPYYTIKDTMWVVGMIGIFLSCVLLIPHFFIDNLNNIPANPLMTPEDIKPLWYFSPFFAILKAVPSKALGIFMLLILLLGFILLPWLDRSQERVLRNKNRIYIFLFMLMCISFCILGYIGHQHISPADMDFYIRILRIAILVLLMYFILMPVITRQKRTFLEK